MKDQHNVYHSPSAIQETKLQEIPEQMLRIVSALSLTENILTDIEKRLQVVLVKGLINPGAGVAEKQTNSPLGNELASLVYRVVSLNERLYGLESSLAI